MSSAQTSNHPLGAVKEFGALCLFNYAWSQKGHSASTRQLYSHQAVKEVGVFYFIIFFWGGGWGGIAIDIHIQRVYIGGPAFSINSQNADVWPEAHAPKCAVNR